MFLFCVILCTFILTFCSPLSAILDPQCLSVTPVFNYVSAFKPCLSTTSLPDCSSLLPSRSCTYLSVYNCLLKFRPSSAVWIFSLAQWFCIFASWTVFRFDLPACHLTLDFPLDSVLLPGYLSKACFFATMHESAFGSLPVRDNNTLISM